MINIIDGVSPLRALQALRRTAKSGATDATGFSKHLSTDEAESASATSGTSPLGAVSGVLGLQEVDDALARAAKGKLRAQDLLDRLDELRVDMLTGALSRDKLLKLAQAVNTRRAEISDPKLGALLDEIDLRAQVELAKYGPPPK